jgi:parvulin-like peptidyl-prolyl isomerase
MAACASMAAGLVVGADRADAQAPKPAPTPAPTPAATASAEANAQVAATVNGDPILVGEVKFAINTTLQQLGPSAVAVPAMEAQVLNQLIDQRLIESFLKNAGKAPTPEEIEAEVDRLKRKVQQEGTTYESFLAGRSMTDATLRDRLTWGIGWPKYARAELNDDALSKFFDEHRQRYDGGEVRASHILFRIEGSRDAAAAEAVMEQAAEIRQQIADGKLTFEDAAARYSAGPSRLRGGDQGFFPRQGLMVEPFADAAFSLKPGEISEPVRTPFGVHLIKVTETKPGQLTWKDARQRVETDAVRTLFQDLGKQQREGAKIEFTGKMPYRELETGKLISPDDAAPAPAK